MKSLSGLTLCLLIFVLMPMVQTTTNTGRYTSDALAQDNSSENGPGSNLSPCVFCHCLFDPDGECCCGGVTVTGSYYCTCGDCGAFLPCRLPHFNCNPSSGGNPGSGGDPGGGGSSGGGGSTGNSGDTGSTSDTPSMQSAIDILANTRVTPATVHASGIPDNANAKQNLVDTSNGLNAKRSSYTHEGRTGPGGEVALSQSLLNGIETLSYFFTLSISEIAGGVHSTTSSHYDGNTMDVNRVDGVHVSLMDPTACQSFEQWCQNAGATYILKESSHYHIKF